MLFYFFVCLFLRIIYLTLKILRYMSVFPDECKDCHDQKKSPATATVQPNMEADMAEGILKERPAEEVAARIAQQNQQEQDIVAGSLAIAKHLHIQHLTGRACRQSFSLSLSLTICCFFFFFCFPLLSAVCITL